MAIQPSKAYMKISWFCNSTTQVVTLAVFVFFCFFVSNLTGCIKRKEKKRKEMMLLLMLGTKFTIFLLKIHSFCMMVLGVVVWYYVLLIQLINVDICEMRDCDDLKTRSVCTPFVWTSFG